MTRIIQTTAARQGFPEDEADSTLASATSARNATADGVAEFATVLGRLGLHDALRYLNGRTRFRFTGVYRCEPPVLIIESLFDRENPSLQHCGGVRKLKGTFCSIVVATGVPFATGNALADPLLEAYDVRHTVASYSGVPIRTPAGRIWGVLCHYDLRPRQLPPGEQKVLASATPYLTHYLDVSPDAATAATAATAISGKS